jgi:hypothetical protein
MKLNEEQISEIRYSYLEEKLGCRIIASKMGLEAATVYKLIKRLKINRQKNWHIQPVSSVNWNFQKNQEFLKKASEQFARYFFILHGAIVHVPDSSAPYDLLVSSEKIGENKKVQVKTSYNETKYGGYAFKLVRTRHNATKVTRKIYTELECDFFFLLDINGNAWLIPFEDLKGKTGVIPNMKYNNFKIT